ncbi:phage tail length tape measure family protein [Thioalkalivibrio sp. ALJ8]|uniref:phage tail length tape measure family protein n=1 Tax=Thioalkalivibrio sp. ALJ8 TaxID=1158757 RepID=UPI0003721BBE|nr:phage tail length tape measure family protein [Thioalkalivibrio sp. ALJ8]
MAGNSSDVDLKIQAIVDGLQNVAALTSELGELEEVGGRQVPDNTEQLRQGAEETSGVMDTLRDNIGKVVAAGAALGGVAATLRSAIGEATEYDTRFRRINAVLETTNRTGEITADRIREIAQELARATLGDVAGFEDAATQLLTFESVTADSMPRILELAQDLAESGFGSLASNARNLGMALDDPAQGLNQLRRTGIRFTDAQRDQIDALIEGGNAAEAQAIILGELEGRVGGVARAAGEGLAGSLDGAAQSWEELRAAAGEALSPAVEAAVDSLAGTLDHLTDNLDGVIRGAQIAGAALTVIAARRVLTGVVALSGQMAGLAASLGSAAAGARALNLAMRAIPFVGATAAVATLVPMLWEWRRSKQAAAEAAEELAESERQLEEQLHNLSLETGVAIDSMEDFHQAVEDGRLVFDDIEQRYISAEQQAARLASTHARLADEMEAAAIRSGAMGDQLQRMAELYDRAQRADALAEQFRTQADTADDVTEAVREVIDSVDLANRRDVGDLAEALRLLRGDASALADTVRDELGGALADLGSADIAAFRDGVQEAFEEARISAEDLAEINESVLAASFDRLGTSFDKALGRIPSRSQDAVQSIQNIVASMQDTTLASEETERALTAAFEAAIPRVDSTQDIDALRTALEQAGAAGLLTAEQMQELQSQITETAGTIRELTGELESLTVDQLAQTRAALGTLFEEGQLSAEEYREEVARVDQAMRDLAESAREARREQREAADATRDLADQTDRASDSSDDLTRAAGQVTTAVGQQAGAYAQTREEMQAYQSAFMQVTGGAERVFGRLADIATREGQRAVDAVRAVNDQLRRMDQDSGGAASAVDQLRVRFAELTEGEAAAAELRSEQEAKQLEMEIQRTRLAAQRASLQGDDERAQALQKEMALLQEQSQLLRRVQQEERREREERDRAAQAREREREAERRAREEAARAPAEPATRPDAGEPTPTRTVRMEIEVGGRRSAFDVVEGQEDQVERLFRELESQRSVAQ